MAAPGSLSLRQRYGYWLIALLSAALAIGLWSQRADTLLERLDRMTLDLQMQVRGRIEPGTVDPVALVAIDDKTLQTLGGSGPDRARHAELLQKLRAAGARAVVVDILMPETGDKAADVALAAELQSAAMPVAMVMALPHDSLMQAGAPVDVLLGHAFMRAKADSVAAEAVAMKPKALVAPASDLAQATSLLGHVSARRSPDGTLRYDLPALQWQGEWFPSVALRVAGWAKRLDWGQAEFVAGEAIRWGNWEVPLDAASRQWVNYYGREQQLPTFSYVDVLEGKVGAQQLKGRLVVLGATALGTGDVVPSPFDSALPGMERLGTVIDNLLTGRNLRVAKEGPLIELAAMLGLPFAVAWAFSVWSGRRSLAVVALSVVVLLTLAQWDFVQNHRFLSLAFPLLAVLTAVVGSTMLRGHAERLRKEAAMQALRLSEERYALAAQGANDGLWDWDIAAGAVHLSERWFHLMGQNPTAGATMDAFTATADAGAKSSFEAALQEHLKGRSLQLHHVLQFREGEQERALLVRGMATRDDKGQPLRMAGSLTDISDTLRLQRQLVHDALHDRLTGLDNRALFIERLEQLVDSNVAVGVVLLGVDGFRALNEAEGSVVGDGVLRQIAKRLNRRGGVIQSVARMGPDVFGVAFVAELTSSGLDRERTPVWVKSQLDEPIQVSGKTLPIQATVGWAHKSQGPRDAADLLACAEMALALGKARQRGQIRAYDPTDQLLENSRRWLHENLSQALTQQQFRMYYQPLVRLEDRKLLGFEALIRWIHPERGFIMPGDFIPYAEESGQIVPMGQWTLLAVAEQLREWDAMGFDGEIAVNLSSRQFVEGDLQADARATIERLNGLDPHRLKLEVTESMAMANPAQTAEALQDLAKMGFKISIDDFGTGYSSLAYLHQFPFDTLKIDRSFVMRLHAGRDAVEIVRTIVGLVKALGKQALAEGVEEERQAQLLHELGVHIGQGWLFGKALPVDEARAMIERQLRDGRV
ncbi:EAL domain-containing protein [Inhella gelatinilytica]|uniref:EAL domain-containing protein n=1 Tax=Inhella gelatinilytica TaxID=2795030 RepID=A0A931NFL0_9BURK|nr:EAL domain-containing protein [Inhella gelatinilytica]MBH9554345.1 EAL domain-containing protein [Inhella gelatinilytica]